MLINNKSRRGKREHALALNRSEHIEPRLTPKDSILDFCNAIYPIRKGVL